MSSPSAPFVQPIKNVVNIGPLQSLKPSSAPWDWESAIGSLIGMVVVTAAAVHFGNLDSIGMAYFGAAVSCTYLTTGAYRSRLALLFSQTVGASAGIMIGTLLPHSPLSYLAAAAVAGMLSGMLAAIGPVSAAFMLMLLFGLSYGQFSETPLPLWQQIVWYWVGSMVIALAVITPWILRPGRIERMTIASVFDAMAQLTDSVATPDGPAARRRLMAATAAGRAVILDHNWHKPTGRSFIARRWRRYAVTMTAAWLASSVVTALYADGEPVPASVGATLRAIGDDVRNRRVVDRSAQIPADTPALAALAQTLTHLTDEQPLPGPLHLHHPWQERLTGGLRAVVRPIALNSGARLAVCLVIATAFVIISDNPSHAYWIPFTVAAVVKPELTSVVMRTTNRVFGTLVGALIAAAYLMIFPDSWPVAIGCSLAIAWAALSVPKGYGWSVIGRTTSTLLAMSIGTVAFDPAYPLDRLIDTVIGVVIALVFGYLLWPGRKRLPEAARLENAAASVATYFTAITDAGTSPHQLIEARYTAFRRAHAARAALEAARTEPPPVNQVAGELLPAAHALEDAVDALTALEVRRAQTRDLAPQRIQSVTITLERIGQLGSAQAIDIPATPGPRAASQDLLTPLENILVYALD